MKMYHGKAKNEFWLEFIIDRVITVFWVMLWLVVFAIMIGVSTAAWVTQ